MRKVVVFQAEQLGYIIKGHHFDYTREVAKIMGHPSLYRYTLHGSVRQRYHQLDVEDACTMTGIILSDSDQGKWVKPQKFVPSFFNYERLSNSEDRSDPELITITDRYIMLYPEFTFARIIELPDDLKLYRIQRGAHLRSESYERVYECNRVLAIGQQFEV